MIILDAFYNNTAPESWFENFLIMQNTTLFEFFRLLFSHVWNVRAVLDHIIYHETINTLQLNKLLDPYAFLINLVV